MRMRRIGMRFLSRAVAWSGPRDRDFDPTRRKLCVSPAKELLKLSPALRQPGLCVSARYYRRPGEKFPVLGEKDTPIEDEVCPVCPLTTAFHASQKCVRGELE